MKQNSVVVMPTLKRPEFLALALEKISLSNNPPDDIRIFLDTCPAERLDEVEYVRDTYLPTAQIFQAGPHIAATSGCWNILNSIKQGSHTGADYVFLIEEDVMVFPDFFNWSLEMHKSDDYFATCGRLRKEHSSDYYTNPGACISRNGLKHLLPYINDRYFADCRGYLDMHFPLMEEASHLDDGLIRRVIKMSGMKIAYPLTPKVAHQGFHFYNQFQQYTTAGPIQERIFPE